MAAPWSRSILWTFLHNSLIHAFALSKKWPHSAEFCSGLDWGAHLLPSVSPKCLESWFILSLHPFFFPEFQPAETSNSVWIALVCLGVVILIILCVAAFIYNRRWRTESHSSPSSEEMVPFNQESPINNGNLLPGFFKAQYTIGNYSKQL